MVVVVIIFAVVLYFGGMKLLCDLLETRYWKK